MLPCSVRRVAAVPPTPLVSSLSTSAPRAAATVGIARPIRHQRRWSSSKPSSSDNGPKDIPGQSAVPASASSRSGQSKTTGEKRKRKSKDSAERNASQKLPSVPSTQHLSQEGLFWTVYSLPSNSANSQQPLVYRPSSLSTARFLSHTACPSRLPRMPLPLSSPHATGRITLAT